MYCTYNVTLKHMCATIVAVESSKYYKFWVCVCCLSIQHEMRMRPIVLCGLSGCTVFFHIMPLTARLSRKNLLNMKCVFWFSLQLLSDTYFIRRRTEREIIKSVYWSVCEVPVTRQIVMKLEFSQQIKKKIQFKFHENSSAESRVVPCGQIDGRTNCKTDIKLRTRLKSIILLSYDRFYSKLCYLH